MKRSGTRGRKSWGGGKTWGSRKTNENTTERTQLKKGEESTDRKIASIAAMRGTEKIEDGKGGQKKKSDVRKMRGKGNSCSVQVGGGNRLAKTNKRN